MRSFSSASLPLKLAFSISVAFAFTTFSSSSPHPLSFFTKPPSLLSLRSSSSAAGGAAAFASSSSCPPPEALAADLLALLGSPQDAAQVPENYASQLSSCLRFIVPFSPPEETSRRKLQERKRLEGSGREADEMVWWPPAPVMELARLALDSGGDPGVIHRTLDPTVIPVPDVEDSKEDKCQLTRTPYAYRFAEKDLNSYFAFLFELIAARAPSVGLNVSLSRHDLFHGHLFIGRDSGRLGILFHAKEYPAYQKEVFPYQMGYCQTGSNVIYDDSMNLRNILWLAPLPNNITTAWMAPGVLVLLDAHPEGIIYKELIPEYVQYVRTIYEDDFGEVVVDVNYLNIGNVVPSERVFIC